MSLPLHSSQHNTLLLLGATGDLAQRYLLPSLLRLRVDGLIPETFRIRAISRSAHDTPKFHAILRNRFTQLEWQPSTHQIDAFLAQLDYVSVDMSSPETMAEAVRDLASKGACISYVSLPPGLYINACKGLALGGALAPPHRLMMEKPIGENLEDAKTILHAISEHIDEARTFRLDHYLGKASVQNILPLRFSNALFQSIWNKHTIASVHIVVAETEGVEGRNAYYAQSGALRDMVQSHILQLLCLVAMDVPKQLDAQSIRNEKIKILRALVPITTENVDQTTVRGRYTEGVLAGERVPGYVPPDPQSAVETFVGVTAHLNDSRWQGVPFYLCTGKRMAQRNTCIVVTFKQPSPWLFPNPDAASAPANQLVITLQPEESIVLHCLSSLIGPEFGTPELCPVSLALQNKLPRRRNAYERLFIDAIQGQSALFIRDDEVLAAWTWIDGIIQAWTDSPPPLLSYAAGSWGPEHAKVFLPPSIYA